MPVGIPPMPKLNPVPGITLGTTNAGIKQTQRDDLVVISLHPDSQVAAVFTQNRFCAGPVTVAKRHLEQTRPKALIINSGNANAGLGQQSIDMAEQMCRAVADADALATAQVLPFSTGVIGEPLPVARIAAALPGVLANRDADHWAAAARAIMTTDTAAKGTCRVINSSQGPITLTGIAKGSGMIHPNMATMLSFIGTDAGLDQACLNTLLKQAVAESFNRISVDGDTSTNDACVLIATGQSGVHLDETHPDYADFANAVRALCQELAELIVRDGEGASKLIRIHVSQARSEQEAEQVAKTIAHSPLVKTAFFASDPNWGRILAAVGRAGLDDLDTRKVDLWLDEVLIVQAGGRALSYTETQGQQVMNRHDITIQVKLGRGNAASWVLTCDLSHDYVRINADYRS
ncbi:MAG: bifunctional glutamate N-acetyltransferase/amino-acid acetyltransferase ArgJ [Methylococcales bacterium]|nr:bifunctional glutamate N-acetyltransferase/amino-acid acetyltransferase ArgJ [Methylococcales bacterium]